MEKKIYFIGIGGIGMSALARFFLARNNQVFGSDLEKTEITDGLYKDGAKIFIEQNTKNICDDFDIVIINSAIKEENIELKEARKKNLKIKSYFDMLGEISKKHETIAVCGTHGKSTTTAMLSKIFIDTGKSPLVFLGSLFDFFGNKNFYNGTGKNMIVEACEYKKNFLKLNPKFILFLNCEAEHLDFFKNKKNYFKTFSEFCEKVCNENIVANGDDGEIKKILKTKNVCYFKKNDFDLNLKVFGEHNKMNAIAAISMSLKFGIEKEKAIKSVNNFTGIWRRLERKKDKNNILFFTDYAHHPTEIKATLTAISDIYKKTKIFCIFQPHQISRTISFLDDFKTSFKNCSEVLIPNIFDARGENNKFSVDDLVYLINKSEKTEIAKNTKNFENTVNYIKKNAKKNDIVIFMGAGDVYKIYDFF